MFHTQKLFKTQKIVPQGNSCLKITGIPGGSPEKSYLTPKVAEPAARSGHQCRHVWEPGCARPRPRLQDLPWSCSGGLARPPSLLSTSSGTQTPVGPCRPGPEGTLTQDSMTHLPHSPFTPQRSHLKVPRSPSPGCGVGWEWGGVEHGSKLLNSLSFTGVLSWLLRIELQIKFKNIIVGASFPVFLLVSVSNFFSLARSSGWYCGFGLHALGSHRRRMIYDVSRCFKYTVLLSCFSFIFSRILFKALVGLLCFLLQGTSLPC